MKAELEYLLARKSKNSENLSDAAKYLATIGLVARIAQLDDIKEEELDGEIDLLKMLIAHEESAFKKRKIEQQGSGGMDVPILIILSSQ